MERRNRIIIRRCVAVITMIICLGVRVIPAVAEETDPPKVTFENRKNESPDLFIKKQVRAGVEGYEIPVGKKFTFILKLDGELANRREYRVFDAKGEEVFEKDIFGNRKTFLTDRSGKFILQAGQMAMFEYVGSGVNYEVIEREEKEYLQIQPQGGAAATGTVQPSGSLVNFVNLYLPESRGNKTDLIIRKSISFPEGYVIPETPEFTFRLILDGKLYANEKYEVRDLETDEVLMEKSTDSKGEFLLRGGCAAIFRNIPTDIDYLVEEIESKGWEVTGDSLQEGATAAPGTIVCFNNKNALFAVSKEVEGESDSKTEFEFLLTRADRTVWEGASYYLYRTADGTLENEMIHRTEMDGTFSLKSGQTAIFCGVEPGEIYNVSEKANPDYCQILPGKSDGYKDKIISDNVEILPFINKKISSKGILSVTKNIENVKGTAAFAQDLFYFILYRKDSAKAETSLYEPVKNAVYNIRSGGTELTGKTDSGGGFYLKANETARFTELSFGEYKVEESDLSVEYVAKDSGLSKEGILGENGLQFTFVNLYLCKELDLYLTKKNRDGQPLSQASFMLYRDFGLTNAVEDEPVISGEDGMIYMMNLKAGTYYLTEIQSPRGYRLQEKPIKIDIVRKGANMEVTVDGNPAGTDAAGQIYTKINAEQDDEVYITVYNSRNFLLPMTGGNGEAMFVITGISGVLLSIWSYIKRTSCKTEGTMTNNHKRKRRKRQ